MTTWESNNMDIKKLLLTAVPGGFGMWVVAGVWHNLIMAHLYAEVHATHDGIGLLLIAYLILALLMSYLYQLSYRGGSPIMEGVKIGVVVGILWVFPHGLAMAGAHDESLPYVFKNTAWHIVEQGVGGLLIGLVYLKLMKLNRAI